MKIDWTIVKGFLISLKRPLALAIESTNDCNAKCIMCEREKLARGIGTLDFDLFKKIILDAKKRNISIFQLSFYGESLLDPLLFDKIEFISAKIPSAWIQIVTNGSLLNRKNSLKLLKLGISEIRISIEGNNKEEFEAIRIGLNFDDLLKNLSQLKALRDSDEKFNTQIIITGLNLKKYPLDGKNYKKFWIKYSDKVLIRDEHILDFEKKESFLQKILPCHQLFTILPVLTDGKCPICIYDWYGKTVYSDLINHSIAGVWFAPKFTLYRILHLIGLKKTIKFCRNCSYKPNYKKIFVQKQG